MVSTTILLFIALIDRVYMCVSMCVFGVFVCVCLVCVLLDSAPVCLEAGKTTASHFWLELVW